jgi:hypothetical protein
MVPDMRPIRLHNRPIILARLLCLVFMLALLANPVLAVVSTAMGCSGTLCCCADTGLSPTLKIGDDTDTNSACCSPTGSIPCRVTTASLPDAPLALIQTAQRAPHDTIQLLSSGFDAAVNPQTNHISSSRTDTDAVIPTAPLYLQSCRFIC